MVLSHSYRMDPEIEAALAEQSRLWPVPELTDLPLNEARRLFVARNQVWDEAAPYLPVIQDFAVPTPAGNLRARRYAKRDARGAILYLHGGGWMFGSVDSHDLIMRMFAAETGRNIFGIDYRLAPENPYPRPLDDCVDTFLWLKRHGGSLGAGNVPIALVGDSAGANLALATCIKLTSPESRPAAAYLFYGAFAPDFDTKSYVRFGDGTFGMSSLRMRRFWRSYVGDSHDFPELAAPLFADLSKSPPIGVAAAELDPLLDDSIDLVHRFQKVGIDVALAVWKGCPHGFLHLATSSNVARRAVRTAAEFLVKWTSQTG